MLLPGQTYLLMWYGLHKNEGAQIHITPLMQWWDLYHHKILRYGNSIVATGGAYNNGQVRQLSTQKMG
jgi:hypothetical protein